MLKVIIFNKSGKYRPSLLDVYPARILELVKLPVLGQFQALIQYSDPISAQTAQVVSFPTFAIRDVL